MKSPWFLALDVDSDTQALRLVDLTVESVGGYKIGPRLCLRYGPDFVRRISQRAPVFLDFKFYDIPSTLLAAVQAGFDLGASFVTVHAANGLKALTELAELEAKLQQQREFRVLAVTVLTSFTQDQLPTHWRDQSVVEHMGQMLTMVKSSGLRGVVCSPLEVAMLRQEFSEGYFVTPGVRSPGEVLGDQQRVMTPSQAMVQGASALVVGRPVIQAKDPALAAQSIFAELAGV